MTDSLHRLEAAAADRCTVEHEFVRRGISTFHPITDLRPPTAIKRLRSP